MCGLCGLLGVTHWTETAAHAEAFAGDHRATIRAERRRRAALATRALAPLRMTVRDVDGVSYQISSATGRHELLHDLSGVWGAVERLRGDPLDPLSPGWIQAMRADSGRRA